MDYVSSFILEDLDIRGAVVHLGSTWRAMQLGRNYSEAARTLLGEMSAVTALIGSNLKSPGRITFQAQGHGAIRLLVVDCDEQLRLRGTARGTPDLAPAPVPALLGDGQLVLTLHARTTDQQPYQSIVPLQGNTIAAIFEHYFVLSEQAASRLWLSADAGYACGLFLQKLPDADRKDVDGWNRAEMLASTVTPAELALPAETLLGRLFPEENVRLFAPREVSYYCPRDESKVIDMLRSLGEAELASILAEHGEIVIQDEICNHEYRFSSELLTQLFPPEQRTFH